MATIEDGGAASPTQQKVQKHSARMSIVARQVTGSYKQGNQTGTIAAALGANSSVYASRLDPGAGADFIARMIYVRLRFQTIVAFTTAVTAGRRLALFRGSGAAPSGGTTITVLPPTDSNFPASEMVAAQGGATHIATTGALTVAGITFEADPFGIMNLTHVGAAGAMFESIWEWNQSMSRPIYLRQGELWAVRNPVAMDAAGTWQLTVEARHDEIAAALIAGEGN